MWTQASQSCHRKTKVSRQFVDIAPSSKCYQLPRSRSTYLSAGSSKSNSTRTYRSQTHRFLVQRLNESCELDSTVNTFAELKNTLIFSNFGTIRYSSLNQKPNQTLPGVVQVMRDTKSHRVAFVKGNKIVVTWNTFWRPFSVWHIKYIIPFKASFRSNCCMCQSSSLEKNTAYLRKNCRGYKRSHRSGTTFTITSTAPTIEELFRT